MKAYLRLILDYSFYVFASFFFVVLFILLLTSDESLLKGSVIDYANVKSDEFDGTVYPIEYAPNPFLLTYEQRKKNYNDIDSKYFIKMPIYNPNVFGKNPDDLKVGSKEYEDTVTQRLIYTIPYMSTYNFDYKEYTGGHPGVDIVVPNGTPVKNISNGVVVDVGNNTPTFGNYVLIRHDNVPLPNGEKGTIYSLYGHMQEFYVKPGDKVKKGVQIGIVGHSGIATTDHLHFQIDTDGAPFHPYWPFSANDMKKAGVSFFDAVNVGLGKDDALKYTLNPFSFVNANLSNGIVSKGGNDKIVLKDPEVKNNDTVGNKDNNDVKLLNKDKDFRLLNNLENVIGDDNPKVIKSVNVASADVSTLTQSFQDLENTDKNQLFKDIKSDYKYLDQLKYFKDQKIISGFKDNTFRPSDNLTRAETLKIILLGFGNKPQSFTGDVFKDVKTDSWVNGYVNYAITKNIISKKSEKFLPNNNITRIEAVKMIANLYDFDFDYFAKVDYKVGDIDKSDWKYPYALFAVKNNLFQLKDGNFAPDKPITREELVYILYKIIKK